MATKGRGVVRAFAVTAGAAALAVLSWASASDRATAQSTHPEKSYFGGTAAARTAFAKLAANDPQTALALARRAVRTAPVDPSSTSALGSALLTLGRTDDAYAAFTVAGSLGWRDVPTQLYWLAQAEAAGDVDVLAQRLDALLRLNIRNELIQNALHVLARSTLGQNALAMLLTRNPPWGSRFTTGTGALEGADLAGRMAAIDLAVSKGARIDCNDVGIAARHLISKDHPNAARDLWRHACDRSGNGLIFNGGFDTNPGIASRSPFTWQLRSEAGLDVAIRPGPKPLHGDALKIASSMTVRTIAAHQIMALLPGSYRLSWMTALDDGRPDTSIKVLVYCADAGSKSAAEPELGTMGGNRAATEFTVPSEGCPIQTVGIQKAATGLQGAETGWIDNIQIVAISSTS
ncbi:hypothetical protein DFR49_4364 [Hephaestia caeni]|uniref:Tetratricopeptide repeat protein n=2 Tax=Hephaestia caeni TaxID=645617 RepID=A0A397ND69_9SPHN|nr:hypothetical protein DFR49_4364 [Hephaestia caeni]